MKNHPTKILLALAALYAYLFYNLEIGVNLLIFDAVLLLATLKLRPDLAKHNGFVVSIIGLLVSALSVVVVHSPASILAHHVSFLLLIGFARARELRFVWFGLLLGFWELIRGPVSWMSGSWQKISSLYRGNFVTRVMPVLVAMVIVIPFSILYLEGNEALGALLGDALNGINLSSLGTQLGIVIPQICVCVILCAGLLSIAPEEPVLLKTQRTFSDHLTRKQHDFRLGAARERTYKGLLGEARIAAMTFSLLNLLLLIMNAADLRFIWLPAGDLSAATLSQYVHVGTYNLIASIILAIAVVLFFFRGNLNFLEVPKLKFLARLWIVQNVILLTSVGIRNYHYVDAYGLAMGRVYVIFVLFILAFGLYTLYRKVSTRLSITYLLQSNGMALWVGLLVFGAVNWPGMITRFNLATQPEEEIDRAYLLNDFDGRNYYILVRHGDRETKNALNKRSYKDKVYTDWRSWNYAEWRNTTFAPE